MEESIAWGLKKPFGRLVTIHGTLLVAFETTLFSMLSLNGRGTWHQQQHQIIKSKGYENYQTDYQRNNALILNQILSTILKRNAWRSVLRICMWIMGLKGVKQFNILGLQHLWLADSIWTEWHHQGHPQLGATDSGAWFLWWEGLLPFWPSWSWARRWLRKGARYDKEP